MKTEFEKAVDALQSEVNKLNDVLKEHEFSCFALATGVIVVFKKNSSYNHATFSINDGKWKCEKHGDYLTESKWILTVICATLGGEK